MYQPLAFKAKDSVVSWLRQDIVSRFYPFFRFVAMLVEPFLYQIRRVFPVAIGRVDLSPILAIFVVELVKFGFIYLINTFYG